MVEQKAIDLGTELSQIREQRDIPLSKVAEISGVSVPTLSRIEGGSKVRKRTAFKVRQAIPLLKERFPVVEPAGAV